VYFGHFLGFGGFGHLLGLGDILVIFSCFLAYLVISGVFWSFFRLFHGYFAHFRDFEIFWSF